MKLIYAFLFTLLSLSTLFSVEQQLIVIRHGEAGNNIEGVYNSDPANCNYKPFNLTDNGMKVVRKAAKELMAQGFSDDNIAAVFVSPLPRTKQTADLLVQQGLVSKDKIIIDKRLIEVNAGDLEGKPTFSEWKPSFTKEYHTESNEQVKERVKNFYDSILKQYPEGNIIVVTHGIVSQDLIEIITHHIVKLKPGEVKILTLRE